MNFKTTLVLILLLVVVGGYIILDRVGSVPEAAVRQESGAARGLVEVVPEAVRGIEIRAEGKPVVVLAKDGRGEWTMGAEGLADAATVSAYLSRVAGLASSAQPGAAQTEGFVASVTVLLRGTNDISVSVGKANALSEAVAKVETGGKTTWGVVAGEMAESLKSTVDDFRDPRLVRVGAGEVSGFVIEAAGGGVVSASKSGGVWRVEDAVTGNVEADPAAVEAWLSALTSLRAAAFPKYEVVSPLSPGQLTIRYTTGAPATRPTDPAPVERVVRIGRFEDARREKVFSQAEGMPVALVPATALTALRKSGLDLRTRTVAVVVPAEVMRVQIVNVAQATTRPETANTLTRSAAGEWLVNDAGADAGRVEALLSAVAPLRAKRFFKGEAALLPVTPWLVRVQTAAGLVEFQVGPQAVRIGELTFEPEQDWEAMLSGGFKKAEPPVPFVNPEPPATQPVP